MIILLSGALKLPFWELDILRLRQDNSDFNCLAVRLAHFGVHATMVDWNEIGLIFTPFELQRSLVLGVSDAGITRLSKDGVSQIDGLPWPKDLSPNDRFRLGREWFVDDGQLYVNWSTGALYEGRELIKEIDQATTVGKSAVEYAISYSQGVHSRLRARSQANSPVPDRTQNFLDATQAKGQVGPVRNTEGQSAIRDSNENPSTQGDGIRGAAGPRVLFVAPLEAGSELVAGTHLVLIRKDRRINSIPSVKCLLFDQAVESNVVSYLLSRSGQSVRLVKGCAHGSPDTLFGFDDRPAISRDNSASWAEAFRGKIVHMCACETASTVGGVSLCETLINKGAAAAIGYKDMILAPYRPQAEASSFDHFVDLELLNGGTCQDGVERFKLEIKNWLSVHGNDLDDYTQQLNSLLETMSESLVVKGDATARL